MYYKLKFHFYHSFTSYVAHNGETRLTQSSGVAKRVVQRTTARAKHQWSLFTHAVVLFKNGPWHRELEMHPLLHLPCGSLGPVDVRVLLLNLLPALIWFVDFDGKVDWKRYYRIAELQRNMGFCQGWEVIKIDRMRVWSHLWRRIRGRKRVLLRERVRIQAVADPSAVENSLVRLAGLRKGNEQSLIRSTWREVGKELWWQFVLGNGDRLSRWNAKF